MSRQDKARPQHPRSDLAIGSIWLAWDSVNAGEDEHRTGHRSLVAVVGPPERQFGIDWIPVAGVDERVDAATDADACFESTESTLGHPIRVRTDYMAAVERDDLSESLGSLDATLAEQLVSGKLKEGRYGHPLGTNDWRIAEDDRYWRGWWDRRSHYDDLLLAAEDAADQCWRSAAREWWQEAVLGGATGAWRRLLSTLPVPGEEIPHPAKLFASTSAESQAHARGFWPFDIERDMDVQVARESNSRITVTGLPSSLNGLSPVAASPALVNYFSSVWLMSQEKQNETEDVYKQGLSGVNYYGPPAEPALPALPAKVLNQQTADEWLAGDFGLLKADSPIKAGATTFTLPRTLNPQALPGAWDVGLELLPPI